MAEGLRWEPGEARLRLLLRRLQQTSHLLDRSRRLQAVSLTLWRTRGSLAGPRIRPSVDHRSTQMPGTATFWNKCGEATVESG